MPVSDELAFTPAHVLREKIARKEISPVEPRRRPPVS